LWIAPSPSRHDPAALFTSPLRNVCWQRCAGIFYGGDGSQLAANFLFVLFVLAWTGAWSVAVFGSLMKLDLLRVNQDTEVNWAGGRTGENALFAS